MAIVNLSVGAGYFTDEAGKMFHADHIKVGQKLTFNIGIVEMAPGPVPVGTQVEIELGKGLVPDTSVKHEHFEYSFSGTKLIAKQIKEIIGFGELRLKIPVTAVNVGESTLKVEWKVVDSSIEEITSVDNWSSLIYTVNENEIPVEPTPTPKEQASKAIQLLVNEKIITKTELKAIEKRFIKKYKA